MIKDMMEMAKSLDKIVAVLKEHPEDKDDVIKSMDDAKEQLKVSVDLVRKIMNNVPQNSISPIQVVAVKMQIENDTKNFNISEYEKNVMEALELAHTADKELGYTIIYPYIKYILTMVEGIVAAVNSETAGATKEFIEKFEKKNGIEI